MIVKTLLGNRSHDVIVDLGAGTGTVIFPLAERAHEDKLRTRFIGVEIHPLLVLIMQIKRLFHPNKKNISVVRQDMLKANFKKFIKKSQSTIHLDLVGVNNKPPAIMIYLYIGNKVIEQLKKQFTLLPRNTIIVSYMYAIPGWEKRLTKTVKGIHPLYLYFISPRRKNARGRREK